MLAANWVRVVCPHWLWGASTTRKLLNIFVLIYVEWSTSVCIDGSNNYTEDNKYLQLHLWPFFELPDELFIKYININKPAVVAHAGNYVHRNYTTILQGKKGLNLRQFSFKIFGDFLLIAPDIAKAYFNLIFRILSYCELPVINAKNQTFIFFSSDKQNDIAYSGFGKYSSALFNVEL